MSTTHFNKLCRCQHFSVAHTANGECRARNCDCKAFVWYHDDEIAKGTHDAAACLLCQFETRTTATATGTDLHVGDSLWVSPVPSHCDLCGMPHRTDFTEGRTKRGIFGCFCWSCWRDHGDKTTGRRYLAQHDGRWIARAAHPSNAQSTTALVPTKPHEPRTPTVGRTRIPVGTKGVTTEF